MSLLKVAVACALAMLVGATPGISQQWPDRTVKVVVPYGVGGVTDTMARLTADKLSKALGQPFVIENRPGAGAAIGIDYALRAPRDGYTILFVGSTVFTVLPLAQKVSYDPATDLVPVSITGTNGMVMVANNDAPFSSVREFIAYARERPGEVSYSSGGAATNNHLVGAYLAGREGLNLVHVPFGSGPASLTALLSKSVQMHFGNSSDLIEPVKSGTVKALAVSSRERMPQLPTVPTVGETIPGFEYVAWNGYVAPSGVPQEVVARLSRALQAIAKDPDVTRVLSNLGIVSVGNTSAEAAAIIKSDTPLYARIVDMAGLRRN